MTQLKLAYMVAKTQVGQKEVPGSKHNPKIVEYHQACTLQASNDEVAWCSSFVNWCFIIAGYIMNPGSMNKFLTLAKYSLADIAEFKKSAIEVNKFLVFQMQSTIEKDEFTGRLVKLGTRSAAARSWLGFGTKTESPQEGDLVCYERGNNGWSGHIGFLHKQGVVMNETLGGNQSDQVKISNYPRFAVLGYMTEE